LIYDINFTKTAKESLLKIDKSVIKRILSKIEWLGENFDFIKPLALKGNLGEFYKLRVGDYRVIYTVDKRLLKITIHFVAHRREIYNIVKS